MPARVQGDLECLWLVETTGTASWTDPQLCPASVLILITPSPHLNPLSKVTIPEFQIRLHHSVWGPVLPATRSPSHASSRVPRVPSHGMFCEHHL